MTSRRKFLISGALLTTFGAYSYYRGLRFPRLSFEHSALESEASTTQANFGLFDIIKVKNSKPELEFRAIAPEPALHIIAEPGQHEFSISNLAQNANLQVDYNTKIDSLLGLEEQINGINRSIKFNVKRRQEFTFRWQIKQSESVDFAVIGDTGGGSELAWALQRAKQLGADFLLHLGDFNYGGDEYAQAIHLFKNSPIPCYITIGNHDFHDDGLIYQDFLNQLSPMNHAFDFAGTRFVNIDTAASFLPVGSGQRAKLLKQLALQPHDGEYLFFTHRPLKDPRPYDDHDLGSRSETQWLADSIKSLGGKTLLCGHVHHSAELDFMGIKQITAGEGLGYEDILSHKKVSKIMIGHARKNQSLTHSWHALDMPWIAHQNPTHEKNLIRGNYSQTLDWYLNEMPRLD